MGRRIRTGAASLDGGGIDTYSERLLKYIPAEIIALYVGSRDIVPPINVEPERFRFLWWIFWGCAVLTPVYLIVTTRVKNRGPLWIQVLLGMIAFPVWAYALGDPFSGPHYRPFLAAILLGFVTVIFGRIKPKPDPA